MGKHTMYGPGLDRKDHGPKFKPGPGQEVISKMMERRDLEEAVDAYFEEQHCILFGRPFDIHEKDGRETAVQFFADFWEAINGRLA